MEENILFLLKVSADSSYIEAIKQYLSVTKWKNGRFENNVIPAVKELTGNP